MDMLETNTCSQVLTEYAVEQNFIQWCENIGYQRVQISNEKELIENARKQLSWLNRKVLKHKELTTTEMEKFLQSIKKKSVIQCAHWLRDKILLERDDGTKVYLVLVDSYYKNNIYQVANQITVMGNRDKNRYDVTLLINGLPLIQVELKKSGLDINEAINQINRYKKQSYTGLFKFIQIFIASTNSETKYFANTDDNEISKSFTFYWTDADNVRISNLDKFTQVFLTPSFIYQMIFDYMLISKQNSGVEKLIVMRPYQVYAVKAALRYAIKLKKNCYIWHVTASGKTLTSWRISRLLMQRAEIDKVVFLSDRTELDEQTTSEFEKFDGQFGSSKCIDDTDELVDKLLEVNTKFINTMVHKMSRAVTNPKYKEKMKKIRNMQVVFIVDECHRSQFGEMHKALKSYFKNAIYIGFTGTPIFPLNQGPKDVITADLFGDCAHTYTLPQAIADRAVLPFNIEYYSTMKETIGHDDHELVEGINKEEALFHPVRIQKNVEHICKVFDQKCRILGRKYSAMFTVENIRMACLYYEEFCRQNTGLTVAVIFSDKNKNNSYGKIIRDYNKKFNTNFSDTCRNPAYKRDLASRIKAGQIDLVIVVDMFITGFDAPVVNTLFVDRMIRWQQIMQAFARTMRLEAECKMYGNIVCFRNLEFEVNDALILFSGTNDLSQVLVESYDKKKAKAKEIVETLTKIAPTPNDVDTLYSEKAQKDFVVAYKELMFIINVLRVHSEFKWEHLAPVTAQSFADYGSKYKSLHHMRELQRKANEVSILNDIDFRLELLDKKTVNYDYIMSLLNSAIIADDKNEKHSLIEEAINHIEESEDPKLQKKIHLILRFLRNWIPILEKGDSIHEAYQLFEEDERQNDIAEFATQHKYRIEVLESIVKEYLFSEKINTDIVDTGFVEKVGLLQRRARRPIVEEFVKKHIEQFY